MSKKKNLNNSPSEISQNNNNIENKLNIIDPNRIGEIEYTKVLIKALKEAIEENEKLRNLAKNLLEENEKLKLEYNDKDEAIRELANYYEFCQENHIKKQKKKKTFSNNFNKNKKTKKKKK